MASREGRVHEIKEALRPWLRGEGLRSVERMVGLDRKTVRRRKGALDDALMAKVCERPRPRRPDGHGAS